MSLEFFRAQLILRLLSDTAFKPGQADETLRVIYNWWNAYKRWEAADTFLAAFNEGRMTVRQAPLSQTYGDYKGKTADINFTARHASVEETRPYPEHRYRTGIDSLKERMDPSNFGIDEGERLKYKHGLHDLSGSLLTPTIPKITKQLRWKHGKLAEWISVFMPMAKPEDLSLFNLLNSMAKEMRDLHPRIYLNVSGMRRRMSRIKLAAAEDIGAGLLDIAPNGADPKFRYGLKATPPPSGQLAGIDLTRYQNALNYPSILPEPKAPVTPPAVMAPASVSHSGAPPPPPPMNHADDTNTNEIVICYREHAGNRFPLFTRWDVGRNVFICLPTEPSSDTIPSGEIPDIWRNTVQF